MLPPPPPRLTNLIDDAIAEILLRLPPDEPEHLFRAALVCKPWLRILCDPGFLRRYRAFYGAPPLLGLLRIHESRDIEFVPSPGFVSTTSMHAFPDPPGSGSDGCLMRALDCRHGRVLLHVMEEQDWDAAVGLDWDADNLSGAGAGHLLVWDPVTGDSHVLPDPCSGSAGLDYTAVVFCAADGCDHLDCHGGPFRVAFVSTDTDSVVASMYLSETGAWSAPIGSDTVGNILPRRGVVIGDEVYFTLSQTIATVCAVAMSFKFVKSTVILMYNWRKNCLSVIDPPPPPHPEICNGSRAFMVTEDSSLGLAVVVDSSLYICSRKVNADGSAEWVRRSVIDLEKVMPMAKPCDCYGVAHVVGFAEGVGAIFVNTDVGLFTIEVKSERVKKVGKPESDDYSILPYMSFYTPDRGRLSSLITGMAT